MFLIYALEGCPYSEKAVDFISMKTNNYEIVKVKKGDKINLPQKTFPVIFIKKDKNILLGGYSELVNVYCMP